MNKKEIGKIAIVGYAFRLPGDVRDPETLWAALCAGEDLVTRIDPARWATTELAHPQRSEPGRSITFSAGVLSRIEEFDADFFGISPREAAVLDPQQRLLLELAWECMENARLPPSRMAGSDCAVYVGISGFDYALRGIDDMSVITAHSMTGNTLSIAANRLSYVFDLHGPSLAVDTACSSSLVALHHACNALRHGEASSALVGGVNLLLHPQPFVGFTKASMLAADGRCRAFDAEGAGYVRSEGGAVLLLKPLEQALADGDEVHAVILASGVNTDGARKTGLTIPSSEGQAELMRTVLARSGLAPSAVDFVEAHGTGTAVGDPVEAAAIGAVYGQGRAQPLPIGSIKANLGHMEPAAGMAGLIKALLVLRHGAVPPALHLNTPNPRIDFQGLNLELVRQGRPLSRADARPLVAGVNSFGFGGANAHVLLQAPTPEPTDEGCANEVGVLPPLFLSARTQAALRALALDYAERIAGAAQGDFYDMAHAAAFGRDRLEKRLACRALSPDLLAEALSSWAQGQDARGLVCEEALPEPGELAFVYAGNGAQWHGMGCRLLEESPEFVRIMTDLDRRMAPLTHFSLLEALQSAPAASRLDDTTVAQPLLFALQVGITLLLQAQGVRPRAVAGHSVGEIAAAWAAGALTLDQAVHVICARSQAQGLTRGQGRMAVVGLSPADADALLARLGLAREVVVAGFNSPANLTLSASLEALEQVRDALKAQGGFFRLLDLDYAFHSPCMDPVRTQLLTSLENMHPGQAHAADFVSTVTGARHAGEGLDAEYWWLNVREPVRFAEAVHSLVDLGCRVFVEISPHAILQRYIRDNLGAAGVQGRVFASLRQKDEGLALLQEIALRVQLLEPNPELQAHFSRPARPVRLPNYPWQKERHWHPVTGESLLAIARRRVHPLLGWPVPEAEHTWENVLDVQILPWLADHQVAGAVVFPGAAYLEMALAAARVWLGETVLAVEEVDILAPLVFEPGHARSLRFELNARDGSFQIRARARLSQDAWTLHATGRLLSAAGMQPQARIKPICLSGDWVPAHAHYALTARLGLGYGPAFQGLNEFRLAGDVLEARVTPPVGLALDACLLHPALLDLAYQSLVNFFREDILAGAGVAFLPVRTGRLLCRQAAPVAGFRVRLQRRSSRSVLMDLELLDAHDQVVASLEACRLRAAPLQASTRERVGHWQLRPWPAPHPETLAHRLLPEPRAVLAHLQQVFSQDTERQAWFAEALPLMEALVVAQTVEALRVVERQWGAAGLLERAQGDGYLSWLLRLACQEGGLRLQDGQMIWADAEPAPTASDIWQAVLGEFPECHRHLLQLGRVGLHLPALLLPEGDRAGFLARLSAAPVSGRPGAADPLFAGMARAVQDALDFMAASLPLGQTLRVLEVVDGEVASALAGLEPEGRFEHVLAMVGVEHLPPELESGGASRLSMLDGHGELLSTRPLPAAFDVIILRHTLHRAAHPAAQLARLRQRLAAGGRLLVLERYPDWAADFVSGLAAEWWHPLAGGGFASSLGNPQVWCEALRTAGFEPGEVFTEPAAEGMAAGAYLVCAAPGPLAEPASEPPAVPVASWVFLTDMPAGDLVLALKAALERAGQQVCLLSGSADGLPAACQQVLYLQDWGAGPTHAAEAVSRLLMGVQAWTRRAQGAVPRLWVLTRGAWACADTSPTAAALWGLGRVLMNEHPELDSTLIDLNLELDSASALAHAVACLEAELLRPDGLDEILLNPEGRSTLRLDEQPVLPERVPEHGFRLDFHMAGQLRNLVWLPQGRRPLGPGEVELEVRASGLNFRDVMYLMGLLPDEAVENGFAGASLGLECAGVVTRVGPQVHHFKPGERVMGFGASCFASHVQTRADALVHLPDDWSFEAAATVPTVFFTVYYALCQLADVQPGERVLIHGGAGGVGIAAIQLARHLGAEVFATAGSDEKRDFVRLLGADRVFDSRGLAFADEILACTDGEGVDVILNSLAGEAIRRNLRVLKPFGRFLELGKRDFFENTPVGLRPFKDNISYFGIDADQLLTGRPALAARVLKAVMHLFAEGALTPLPCRVFPARQAVEAFRAMQQARHIGKIVLTFADVVPDMVPPDVPEVLPPLVPAGQQACWLVSGGLAGFGQEVVRWLVARGVTHLLLLGRRGLETPGAGDFVHELQQQGVQLQVHACDVADAPALARVLAHGVATLPPLKGIVHGAAVFDDGVVHALNAERMARVMAPKLQGAWNLHQATRELPIEHFVLFSSVTTAIGNPGQANYVAANMALEALARVRAAQGLAATCVAWGPIGDAGYLTRNTAVRDGLEQRLGRPPLTARQALDALGRLLARPAQPQRGAPTHIVANLEWRTLSRLLASASSARFAGLNSALAPDGAGAEVEQDFRAQLAACSPSEAEARISQLVTRELAQILAIHGERIDPHRPLHDLGLDSLMAVELALALEQRLGIQLPVMLLNEAPSVHKISRRILERLQPAAPAAELREERVDEMLEVIVRQHGEEMSADERAQIVDHARTLAATEGLRADRADS